MYSTYARWFVFFVECWPLWSVQKSVGKIPPLPKVLCYKMFSVWAPPVNDYCVGCKIIKITIYTARNIFIINLNRVWNSINFCSLNFLSAYWKKCNEIANLGCATPTSDRLAGAKTNRKPLNIAVRNRKNELRHDSLFLSCEQASDTMKTERTVSSILSLESLQPAGSDVFFLSGYMSVHSELL